MRYEFDAHSLISITGQINRNPERFAITVEGGGVLRVTGAVFMMQDGAVLIKAAPIDGSPVPSVPSGPVNLLCAVCNLPQVETPSGQTCPNGHGGADGVEADQVGGGIPTPPAVDIDAEYY